LGEEPEGVLEREVEGGVSEAAAGVAREAARRSVRDRGVPLLEEGVVTEADWELIRLGVGGRVVLFGGDSSESKVSWKSGGGDVERFEWSDV
jgi:hypothetical protein